MVEKTQLKKIFLKKGSFSPISGVTNSKNPPTPRPSSRGRRAGRTKPKLDLEKEWQWIARSVFLQPNQYLISTSIQPRPIGYPTKAKCFTRRFQYLISTSIQPRPIIGPSQWFWLRAQRCCPGPLRQPHQGQTHPLLLAGSKVPKRHRLCRPKYPPVGPESCWGSAISDACPRRAVTCRLRIRVKANTSSPARAFGAYSPLLLAGSKVPKRHRLCRPNINPFGPEILLGFCCLGPDRNSAYTSLLHGSAVVFALVFSGFEDAVFGPVSGGSNARFLACPSLQLAGV